MRMRRLRAALALVLAASAIAYGVGGMSQPVAAAAVLPSGGCWGYLPSGAALDAPPASDLPSAARDWSTRPDGGVLLETAGATAVGGPRTVTATIVSGPVISPDAVTGTASFLFSVDGTPLATPVSVPFTAAAGAPVAGGGGPPPPPAGRDH
jgi:hypothetical protein